MYNVKKCNKLLEAQNFVFEGYENVFVVHFFPRIYDTGLEDKTIIILKFENSP